MEVALLQAGAPVACGLDAKGERVRAMTRAPRPLLALLLLTALIGAGCGGDDDSGTVAAPAATATATTEATTATEETTSTETTTSTGASDDDRVKQAIANCKKSIEDNDQVSADLKDDVKAICDKAASGNPQDVRDAIREVCEKIVDSQLPEGDARDQAKKSCAGSGGG